MSPPARLGSLVLLLLAGCPVAPGGGGAGPPPLPPTTERWTLDGAWTGATIAELTSALGRPPDEVMVKLHRWRPSPSIDLGHDGTAFRVQGGRRLLRGATVVLELGASDDEVVAALGEGRLEVHRTPTGSGIITTGSKETSRARRYLDGASSVLQVWLVDGRVTGLSLERWRGR